MKNVIKLLVAILIVAAFACTPPSHQSSNEKKELRDSAQFQTPSDSSATLERASDSSAATK